MRTLGVIAEYNPFHNGHKYHLQKAKSELNADCCIVVMSGNFVQRGEPAIIHKWKRTEMCLQGGADLVIELPVHYATSSAEFFAEGAVKLLDCTKIVDFVSFGAECSSIERFKKTLDYIVNEPPEYKALLKSALSSGQSFPAARAKALAELVEGEPVCDAPNNILAIEYMKALKKINSVIVPNIVERHLADHNSLQLGNGFSSASSIRRAITDRRLHDIKSSVPPETYRILECSQNIFPIDIDGFSDMLIYKIKTKSVSWLKSIFDVSEGLENRITAASDNETIRMIISQIKTKRYTFTKIQRILMHILLDITYDDMAFLSHFGPPYIRVLGFRRGAEALVRELTENASLPTIINLKNDMEKLDANAMKILQKEISSTDIYFIKCPEQALRRKGVEFSFPVARI